MERASKKTEELEKFAIRLRAAMSREKERVTLQQIADACGVAVSTVGAWTQGKNWPQVEVQPKLAHYLKTSIQFLIHGIPGEAEITYPPSMADRSPGVLESEAQSPYGSTEDIEHELQRALSALLKAAGGDRNKLGWISEQMREHLAIPKSWRRRPSTAIVDRVDRPGRGRLDPSLSQGAQSA
jgi:transcriptional regulator with XRE-family HTH domain